MPVRASAGAPSRNRRGNGTGISLDWARSRYEQRPIDTAPEQLAARSSYERLGSTPI